jgi:hypothetical protein
VREEVLSWYKEKRFEPSKVIQVGINRHGLTKSQIEAALEHCYDKILEGKKIPDLEIARYVFNVAKEIDAKKYEQSNALLVHFEKKWKERERKFKWMLYPSWGVIVLSGIAFYLLFNGYLQ